MSGEGYEYAYTYFRTLSPAWLRVAALTRGVAFEAASPLRYLELGCGQGLSLAIHAAASAGEYWGNDLDREHIAHAREFGAAAGVSLHVHADSFAEFVRRSDLPQFDIITLHGVWTWISDEDAAHVADIVRRALAPGGLFYVSYNSKAGWAAASLMRELLRLHAREAAPGDQPPVVKAQKAIAFATAVADGGANHFNWNPTVTAQLRALPSMNPIYLSHEFFGDHWRLMSVGEMIACMREAGLEFAASAFLLENDDRFVLPAQARALLESAPTATLKEAVREFFVNPQFRQDIFVKSPATTLSPEERTRRWLQERVVLTTPPARIAPRFQGPLGEIALSQAVYAPLIAALAADGHAPKTLAQLQAALGHGKSAVHLVDEIVVLLAAGHVRPAASAAEAAKQRASCLALNRHLCDRARTGGEIPFLAAPVLGGGVDADRLSQLFLLAAAEGREGVEGWARFAADCLANSAEKFLMQGRPIDGSGESLAVLTSVATRFEREYLPVLRAVGATLEA